MEPTLRFSASRRLSSAYMRVRSRSSRLSAGASKHRRDCSAPGYRYSSAGHSRHVDLWQRLAHTSAFDRVVVDEHDGLQAEIQFLGKFHDVPRLVGPVDPPADKFRFTQHHRGVFANRLERHALFDLADDASTTPRRVRSFRPFWKSTNASPVPSSPPSRRFSQPTSPTMPPHNGVVQVDHQKFARARRKVRSTRPGYRAPPRAIPVAPTAILPRYQALGLVAPGPTDSRHRLALRTNTFGIFSSRSMRSRFMAVSVAVTPPLRESSIPRPRSEAGIVHDG